jgi:hypothetical protein
MGRQTRERRLEIAGGDAETVREYGREPVCSALGDECMHGQPVDSRPDIPSRLPGAHVNERSIRLPERGRRAGTDASSPKSTNEKRDPPLDREQDGQFGLVGPDVQGRGQKAGAAGHVPPARTARIMAKAPDPVRRSGRVTGPASLLKRGPRGSGEDRLNTASPDRRRLLSRLGASGRGGYLDLGRTSGTAPGNRRSATRGSSHCGGSTLSGRRSPPSLSVPASAFS